MLILETLLKVYYNTASIEPPKKLIAVRYFYVRDVYELIGEENRFARYNSMCFFYQCVYQNLQLQFICDKLCYQSTNVISQFHNNLEHQIVILVRK